MRAYLFTQTEPDLPAVVHHWLTDRGFKLDPLSSSLGQARVFSHQVELSDLYPLARSFLYDVAPQTRASLTLTSRRLAEEPTNTLREMPLWALSEFINAIVADEELLGHLPLESVEIATHERYHFCSIRLTGPATQIEEFVRKLEADVAAAVKLEGLDARGVVQTVAEFYKSVPIDEELRIGGRNVFACFALEQLRQRRPAAFVTPRALDLEPDHEVEAVLKGLRERRLVFANHPTGSSGGGSPQFRVGFLLRNTSSTLVKVRLPSGTVFEPANPLEETQALINAESEFVTLKPGDEKFVDLPAFCLNRRLGPPANSLMYLTPFRTSHSLRDQDSVWDYFESRLENVLRA